MLVKEAEGSVEGEEGLVRIGALSAVMEIIYTSQCEDIWSTKGYNVHVLGYNCLFVCSNVSYIYVCPFTHKDLVCKEGCMHTVCKNQYVVIHGSSALLLSVT